MKHRILTAHQWPICGGPYWAAWSDNLGEDDSPIGTGKAPEEAIADLEWQIEDMESAA